MNIFDQALFYVLEVFRNLSGSYALAIILVTVGIRVLLWPLNNAQTRSMRTMQLLQPKLQELKEKYGKEPMRMQQEMMKLYGEHKFNPLAGCLPMLVQLPLLLALYGVLSSTEFAAKAGNESFLFIDRLTHTLQSEGGHNMDGKFAVTDGETFHTGKEVVLSLKDGKVLTRGVKNPNKPLMQRPIPVLPGDNVTLAMRLTELGLSEDYSDKIKAATIPVVSSKGHELETLTFKPNKFMQLSTSVPTTPGKSTMNWDVLVLVAVYGALTLLYQQQMKGSMPKPKEGDAAAKQAQMMNNMLPLMFLVMMFFIPIPAGVLLYLIVTMLMMSLQSFMISREPLPGVGTTPKNVTEASPVVVDGGKVVDIAKK